MIKFSLVMFWLYVAYIPRTSGTHGTKAPKCAKTPDTWKKVDASITVCQEDVKLEIISDTFYSNEWSDSIFDGDDHFLFSDGHEDNPPIIDHQPHMHNHHSHDHTSHNLDHRSPIYNHNPETHDLHHQINDHHPSIHNTHTQIHDSHQQIHDHNLDIHNTHTQIHDPHSDSQIHDHHPPIHNPDTQIHDPNQQIHDYPETHDLPPQIHDHHPPIHNPHAQIHDTDQQIHDHHTHIHNPHTQIHDTHSQIHDPHTQVHDPHTQIHDPHTQIHDHHTDIHNPHPQMYDPYSEIHDHHSQKHDSTKSQYNPPLLSYETLAHHPHHNSAKPHQSHDILQIAAPQLKHPQPFAHPTHQDNTKNTVNMPVGHVQHAVSMSDSPIEQDHYIDFNDFRKKRHAGDHEWIYSKIHSSTATYHDKRIAGCIMQCIYKKNHAVDTLGWPTLDGLVNFYSEGVNEHGYFMATLRAVDYCLKGASAKYHVNRRSTPEKGQTCDVAFDVFDCISDQITEYCSDHHSD